MQYLTTFKKGKKSLIKIKTDDGKEKWYETSDAVLNYAKKTFEADDEVSIDTKKEGKKIVVTRITAGEVGEEPEPEAETEDSTVENVCEDCGKELKSDKYTKCYTCNKKAQKNGNTFKSKTKVYDGDRNDSIIRQTCIKAAGEAVTVLAGHVDDPETVGDIVIEISEKLYNWVIA